MKEIWNSFINWLDKNVVLEETLTALLIIVGAVGIYFISKKIIIKTVRGLVKKTKTEYDDIIFNELALRKLAFIPSLLIINQFSYLVKDAEKIIDNFTEAAAALLVVLVINNLLTSANLVYERITTTNKKPIKGYIQVIKIIVYILGTIFIIGLLTGQDLIQLLAGVGAFTAVLLLVFKDTILSFIASIQITSYDLLKIGDWIEVPSMGIDGDVMDIALHTIKIRNFDKTITTIPTYKLVETSFKNWRGMQEAGGRRIKRSIHIDLTSIGFCDNKLLEKFSNYQLIQPYLEKKLSEIDNYNTSNNININEEVNGRRLTNIGTFRAYVKEYLKSRQDIHKELTFLIRQLQPGDKGLPLEIYVFTTKTGWIEYEEIQADIFDHLLASLPHFGLRVYQNPGSYDLRSFANGGQNG